MAGRITRSDDHLGFLIAYRRRKRLVVGCSTPPNVRPPRSIYSIKTDNNKRIVYSCRSSSFGLSPFRVLNRTWLWYRLGNVYTYGLYQFMADQIEPFSVHAYPNTQEEVNLFCSGMPHIQTVYFRAIGQLLSLLSRILSVFEILKQRIIKMRMSDQVRKGIAIKIG